MGNRIVSCVLFAVLWLAWNSFQEAESLKQLRRLGYLPLPSYANGGRHSGDGPNTTRLFQMFGGTAEESAYDPKEHILYVVGEESAVLHVVDMQDPTHPRLLLERFFVPVDGTPRDVEVCGSEVAVAFTSTVDVFEGHVHFFRAFSRAQPDLAFIEDVVVGAWPDNIRYSGDCATLVVANEGRPALTPSGQFLDPEGTVTLVRSATSGPRSISTVTFAQFNHRQDIRHSSRYAPLPGPPSSLSQDLQPEYVDVSPDGNVAYVTLQENNAVAVLSLKSAAVTSVTSLGSKDWSHSKLDTSDRDGGVHLATYPLSGLYQPDVIKVLTVGSKTFLVTANEGAVTQFTMATHGFHWSDATVGNSLSQDTRVDIRNQTLLGQLHQDSKLGRLMVSRVDGLGPLGVERLHAFGGRGFSVWDASDLSRPVIDSGAGLEEAAESLMHHVFNTDCRDVQSQSPETLRDHASPIMGPKINALDVRRDQGTVYLVAGSETSGALYLYTLDTAPLALRLHDLHREGATDSVWSDLYRSGFAGDAYISDIRIVPMSETAWNRTLVIVVSNGSGTVSLYEIYDDPLLPDPPAIHPDRHPDPPLVG